MWHYRVTKEGEIVLAETNLNCRADPPAFPLSTGHEHLPGCFTKEEAQTVARLLEAGEGSKVADYLRTLDQYIAPAELGQPLADWYTSCPPYWSRRNR